MSKISCPGIARTCDKIESVLVRKAIDLAASFKDVDPKGSGMVSDEKFFSVVYCKLGHEFGVCQEEVKELGNYFKKEDCRICYQELLKIVSPPKSSAKTFVTGFEWEDHQHVNVISPYELGQLNLILTKMAHSLRTRAICLKPLFQDYERMSHNCGTVTASQFRKILYFAGITLGRKELHLVFKRFMKHNYTVNYFAFLQAIDDIMCWLKKSGYLDHNNNFIENYPGRVITAGVETLPRPEIDIFETFGTSKPCHSSLNQKKPCDLKFCELMIRIKKHIYDNRIRSREFFEKFDQRNYGFITKSQFHRGLDAIGLSGLHRLYVAPHDLEKIFIEYQDPCDPSRVAYSNFCDALDETFTIKCLDKQPYRVIECPQQEVKESPRPGSANWDCIPITLKQLAQETLLRLRNIIKSRKLFIEPFFKDLDKTKTFHISRCQMQRVFSMNSILLSPKEIQALMLRYGDGMGFNFWKFLQDIDDVQLCASKYAEIMGALAFVNTEKPVPCSSNEFSIVDVFAKIKGQVTRKRISMDYFLNRGQRLDESAIPECKFRARFASAGIILEICELDILCKSFAHPCKPGLIDQKLFCKTINEAFYQTKLEKEPCEQPVPHLAVNEDVLNFLGLDERRMIALTLQKISRYHDDYCNMRTFFEDRNRCGAINKLQLKQVLIISGGLMELITEEELDLIFKCFSTPVGKGRTFDFKNFLKLLETLNAMKN